MRYSRGMAERKKILYIITKSSWGGAQRYVYDLATNLPPERFDVVVAAGHPAATSGGRINNDGLLFERLANAGIRAIRLVALQRDIAIGKEIASLRELVRLFMTERPDIVHLNSSKIGALAAIAAKIAAIACRKKIRVAFTVHGWGFYEDRSVLARAAIFAVSFISSFLQDAVITIDTADFHAAQRFIPARKLHLIFNGLGDIDLLPRTAARIFFAAARGRAPRPPTIFIGAVAELTKNKGITFLIDASKVIASSPAPPPFHLFIIGDGEGRDALEAKIRSMGLERIVTLFGFNPDARRLLKGLDIFVLPSLKEGLPYAVMEAMSAGIPIITTRVGGLPDLITSGKDGMLVPPKDSAALARAIELLLRDAGMRARIGARAQEKIKTNFSFHAMMTHTTRLYNSL